MSSTVLRRDRAWLPLSAAGAALVLVLALVAALLVPGWVAPAQAVTAPLKIASGAHHTLVLKADGTVWGAGDNDASALGLGLRPGAIADLTPMIMPAGLTAKDIAAGDSFSLVLGSNGKVYGAGSNGSGELGTTPTSSSDIHRTLTELPLPAGFTATSIGAGDRSSFVIATNDIVTNVYGTGQNRSNAMGPGSVDVHALTAIAAPVGLAPGVSPLAVDSGNLHTVVLYSDGTVYGIGDNGYGQITGVGTTARDTLTAMVLPAGVKAEAISTGGLDTLVIGSDGVAYGTGDNGRGQLGNDPATLQEVRQLTPVQGLPAGVTAVAGAAAGNHTVVVGSDGIAYGTGSNDSGQLTDSAEDSATNGRRSTLKPLSGIGGIGKIGLVSVSYEGSTVVSTDAGVVLGTGRNGYSQLTGSGDKDTLTPFTYDDSVPTSPPTTPPTSPPTTPPTSAPTPPPTTIPPALPAPAPSALTYSSPSKPKITGSAKVGRTLRISTSTKSLRKGFEPDASTVTFRWYRNGVPIRGSRGDNSKLRITRAEKGKKITVRIYGHKNRWPTGSYLTRATKRVAK